MDIIVGAFSQGLIWAIMVIGVYITYRILDFPDLTADGSIALGGAVSAICIVNGVNPILALIASLIAGSLIGFVTGFLHTKLGIPGILAGILSMISLYSINIEVMGRANISLLGEATSVTMIMNTFGLKSSYSAIIIALIIVLILIFSLNAFFKCEIGKLIRATGDNEVMVCSQGKNPQTYKIIAISISNALIALCGGLIAQQQGYAEVTMGTGAIIIGLASIIIGEVALGIKKGFIYKFTSVVVGSIIYRLIIAFILYIGLKPTMLNLLTASIVTIALSMPTIKSKLNKGSDTNA